MADLPSGLAYGKVVFTVLAADPDSADAGRLPDAAVPLVGLTFVPKNSVSRIAGSTPVTILRPTIGAQTNSSGVLVDSQNATGIWLITGQYSVTYAVAGGGPTIGSHDIDVLAQYDDDTPLDLSVAAPPIGPDLTPTQYSQLYALYMSGVGGGGGGDVTSVAGKTGAVTLVANDISNASTVGKGVLTAADAAAARTVLGVGTTGAVDSVNGHTGTVVLGYADVGAQVAGSYATSADLTAGLAGKAATSHVHATADIADATTVGKAVMMATDAAAARTAIGAGLSNLTIGTTVGTAKVGSWTPTAADIPAGSVMYATYSGSAWPARPTSRTDVQVTWYGPIGSANPSGALMGDVVERS
ncbi:hypothetical protein [Luteipulveratus mongoliensis]|uniref:hypothetical protein n=1 Tax=Luteipulveratus mongoliensis TaxID=571913 RepID=UPI000696165C|nr:hypothetical protein [Luteipulveratus mongoliensis]